MQLLILAVGRKLSPAAAVLHDDYQKRLGRWVTLETRLLAPGKGRGQAAINDESQRLMGALKAEDYLILLDEHGVPYTNQQLANHLAKAQQYLQRVVVVIGGAYGVSDDVRARAQMEWSLSALVFPHKLVRIIVMEQLYRTFAIINNHPYHHA